MTFKEIGMDSFTKIEAIPDLKWKAMTDRQQDAYNQRITAKEAYDKTMGFVEPIALFIVGVVVGVFEFVLLRSEMLSSLLCMLAFVWALVRVIDRSHRYQRLKDANEEFNKLMQE